MTFDLHIHGDTPAELLDALAHLGGTTNIITPAPQSQSEPVPQPDKPKAPAPAKQKKAAQKAAAAEKQTAPEGDWTTNDLPEDCVNPTSAAAPNAGAAATTAAPAAKSAETEAATMTTPAGADATATLDKIRDLARSLIVHGKRAEVQQIIKDTGAASISKLPPDSYTDVWQQLVNLSKEVDSNAAD